MAYEAKTFENLTGLEAVSEQTLQNHFTLYRGYVTNTNKLLELLDTKEPETVEYAELQRRLGWEFNGMRLHELYFENLSSNPSEPDQKSALGEKIVKIYGSFEAWQKNFKAVCAMRGIGWAVLYYDPTNKELFNAWINEHDVGHFAGCVPLLIIDVFEHAYYLDHGPKRAGYIEQIFAAIDWKVVEERFEKIV